MDIFIILFFISLSVTNCKTSEVENSICAQRNFTFSKKKDTQIENFCETNLCIAKCCPLGQQIKNIMGKSCIVKKQSEDFTLPIYKKHFLLKLQKHDTVKMKDFTLVHHTRFVTDACKTFLIDSLSYQFYILEDGSLGIKDNVSNSSEMMDPLNFCFDYTVIDDKLVPVYIIEPAQSTEDKHTYVIRYGTLVSCFFLFLTLLIHCLLPKLRNINGKIQMSHMFSLMMWLLLKFSIDQINTTDYCRVTVPIYYFFVLSTFTWLALMSFNIWWTFRRSIQHHNVHRRGETQKFIIYCVCVYLTTAVLTITAIIIDNMDPEKTANLVKPEFYLCLYEVKGTQYYLYIPVGTLTILNCTLFVMTLYNIWKIKRELQNFDKSETRRNNATFVSFKVYTKLSVSMGVGWILQIIQMFTTFHSWLFLVVNLWNAYIGVVIFILFISDRTLIISLLKRFNIKTKLMTENSSTKVSARTASTKIKKTQDMDVELSTLSGALESGDIKRDSN